MSPTSDISGNLQISGLGTGNAVEYQIELEEEGAYAIDLRYNSDAVSQLEFRLDGKSLGRFQLPNTYISWRNHRIIMTMPEGRHTLSMSCTEISQAKINWLRIIKEEKE